MITTVKVWGGTHPDEKAAMAVADSLQEEPLPNVTSGIANPLARKRNIRFVDMNLTEAFPGASNAVQYEKRRAAEVLAESQGFGAVIDLHNITNGANYACIDKSGSLNSRILGFLYILGINILMETDYHAIQKYVPNSLALETLPNGLGGDIEQLRNAIDRLANDPKLPNGRDEDFARFRFVGGLHKSKVTPAIITPETQAFEILPDNMAAAMGYPGQQICLAGWIDEPNAQGYWAELCKRV